MPVPVPCELCNYAPDVVPVTPSLLRQFIQLGELHRDTSHPRGIAVVITGLGRDHDPVRSAAAAYLAGPGHLVPTLLEPLPVLPRQPRVRNGRG